jgi:predicted metal-dependent hydrolase
VQLSFPWSDTVVVGRPDPIVFVRHRRARRFILRVLPNGTIRVTLPRWGATRDARAFVEASRTWIAKQRERREAARRADSGADNRSVLIDGIEATLGIDAGRVTITRDGQDLATLDAPASGVRAVVETWLYDRARRELPDMLYALAATHGIAVHRVSVRNQRSRWGACSPSGTITLNWRLIQTPPFVREYVLLHELMHRRELNHSRRFWRLVATCCPRHLEARRWLKREGKLLWPEHG